LSFTRGGGFPGTHAVSLSASATESGGMRGMGVASGTWDVLINHAPGYAKRRGRAEEASYVGAAKTAAGKARRATRNCMVGRVLGLA